MTTLPSTDAMRWRSVLPDQIIWAVWEEQYIAYHRPSGKTHLLNASSAYLLKEVLVEPLDAESATRALSPADEEEIHDSRVKQVLSMLEHFEHLGLVARA